MTDTRAPDVPDRWDRAFMIELVRSVQALKGAAYQRGHDVEIGVPDTLKAQGARAPRFILVAPNGGRYRVTVSNAGALVVTAV